jgi:predicted O-methyltransferase YrrM
MDLVNPLAEAYAKKYSSLEDGLLDAIEIETNTMHKHAHMLSGSLQGKMLSMFCQMINPLKVLEIGTFTGYSALCLVKGMQANGMLHTIELREADATTAATNFERAGFSQQIQLHVGDALQIIPTIDEIWDLIFIDADKVRYIDYYELTLPKLKKGGWIIADNVLFHGQVLEEPVTGKNAIAIQSFNDHVLADDRVEQMLLPLRDGLMLIRKK